MSGKLAANRGLGELRSADSAVAKTGTRGARTVSQFGGAYGPEIISECPASEEVKGIEGSKGNEEVKEVKEVRFGGARSAR